MKKKTEIAFAILARTISYFYIYRDIQTFLSHLVFYKEQSVKQSYVKKRNLHFHSQLLNSDSYLIIPNNKNISDITVICKLFK